MAYTRHVTSKYINNITSSIHSRPDYDAKIKENPTCDNGPESNPN